MLFDKN